MGTSVLADVGNRELDETVVKDVVVGVGKLDQYPVRTGRQVLDDDGNAACVCPVPREIVNGNMEMSDARRNRERGCAEHRHDPDVLSPVLKDDHAPRQRLCQRRIDYYSGRRLRFRAGYDPRRSHIADRAAPKNRARRGLRKGTGGARQGANHKQHSNLEPSSCVAVGGRECDPFARFTRLPHLAEFRPRRRRAFRPESLRSSEPSSIAGPHHLSAI